MAAPIETLEETVKKKLQSKYNVKLEVEIKEWMEELLGKRFDANLTFQENLKSGVLLCEYVLKTLNIKKIQFILRMLMIYRVLNVISPGLVKKINESSLAFKQMVYILINLFHFSQVICSFSLAYHNTMNNVFVLLGSLFIFAHST